MDWNPIDTAPRDGTWFLGWNGHWRVACWVDPYYEGGGPGELVNDGMRRFERPLTRWMPLPPAPAASQAPAATQAPKT